jgi:SH3 domain-containing protein
MANERKNRRATIVKKEPSFAIASSAVAVEPDEGEDADRWIGIDMAKALPGLAITESMQIIIEGVPDGARFSAGRNNGDKTWSLDPEDLVGLGYLPPAGLGAADQSFFVRLLTFDPDGYQIASTTAQVAVTVDGMTARRPVLLDGAEAEGAVDAIREIEFSQRLAGAEEAWREAEEERVRKLEEAWHSAAEEQLRAAEEAWREGEADRHRALTDQLADVARRLRETEMEWHRGESERISAALAQAADFTAQRFAAAEEQWRIEADRRIAKIQAAAEERVASAMAEAEAEVAAAIEERSAALSAQADAALEERLGERDAELHQLRADFDRLIGERDAEQRALRAELDRSAAGLREAQDIVQRIRNESEAARLALLSELSEREKAWEMERAALVAASAAADPAQGDRIAALEERWRLEAERLSQQAEMRARREAEQRLAEAETAWADIAERRIAEAQRDWEAAAEQRQAELSAREAAHTDEQLVAMRARMAEVERLAAEAERRVAERDRQLAEATAARQNAESGLAAASRGLDEELARRLEEIEASRQSEELRRLEEAQAAWAAGEASRLAGAQTQWIAEEEERLQTAIAAERVMLAGSDTGQMLNQAEARWREAEQERLKGAEERWKMQEDQRVAAAVAAAREDMERMVEARLHRELAVDARRVVARSSRGLGNLLSLIRWSAAGAAAAAAAGLIYVWAPEIRALIPEPQTAVAAAPAVVVRSAPDERTSAVTVKVEFGNLRENPVAGAPVVARLARGTVLIPLEKRGNWIRTAAPEGGSEGWIHSSLLDGPLQSEN